MTDREASNRPSNRISYEGLLRWYQSNKRFADLERKRLFDSARESEKSRTKSKPI